MVFVLKAHFNDKDISKTKTSQRQRQILLNNWWALKAQFKDRLWCTYISQLALHWCWITHFTGKSPKNYILLSLCFLYILFTFFTYLLQMYFLYISYIFSFFLLTIFLNILKDSCCHCAASSYLPLCLPPLSTLAWKKEKSPTTWRKCCPDFSDLPQEEEECF